MIIGSSIIGYLPPLASPSDVRLNVDRGDGTLGTLEVSPSGEDVKQVLTPTITSVPTGTAWTNLAEFVLTPDSSVINVDVLNSSAGNAQIKLTGRAMSAGIEIDLLDQQDIKFGILSPNKTYPIPTTIEAVIRLNIPKGLYSIIVYGRHDAATTGNIVIGGTASAA